MKKKEIILISICVFAAAFLFTACERAPLVTGQWSAGLDNVGFTDSLCFFSDGTGFAGERKMDWEICRKRMILFLYDQKKTEYKVFTYDVFRDSDGCRILALTDEKNSTSLYYFRPGR